MDPRSPQAEPSPPAAGRAARSALRPVLPVLLVLAAALLPVACRSPGPQPPQEPPAGAAVEREDAAPGETLRESDVPFGVFFLHGEDEGIAGCVLVGERETGGRIGPNRPDEEQARARAVLDMAEQARWLGGNVVVLPHFREDFHSGRLRGRVYRCGEAERRAIYRRAAAQQNLTVVPQ